MSTLPVKAHQNSVAFRLSTAFILTITLSLGFNITKAQSRLQIESPESVVAFVGATLIDVSQKGHGNADVQDAIVIMQGDKIIAAGAQDTIQVPAGAKIVNVRGQYMLPGLTDSFATLNNQAYADTYLALGVTSIVGVFGGRRGEWDTNVDPSPLVFPLESVGSEHVASREVLESSIDELAFQGTKVLLLMYGLNRTQVKIGLKRARQHGMATIGELGYTSYKFGNEARFDAFVHTTRYSLDAAPHVLAEGVAYHPFSNDLNSLKWQYYKWITNVSLDAPAVKANAETLGAGPAALIPTLSLLYLDMEDHENPWDWPAAKWINARDVDAPADKTTGNHTYDEAHTAAYAALANKIIPLERLNYQAGATYIAGSATDVWGTMPGISLHTELSLLSKVGLSNREILAAATSNPAEIFKLNGLGEVKAGNRADFIVVSENPLEDLTSLRRLSWVVAGGKLIESPLR